MILDKIILENFCAYGGRQEADLTPTYGKPIILFGGMNGGGKTTLLDAIQLAFYGSKARTSNRGKLNYKDYLRECIHRGSDPKNGSGIAIQFRRIIEGKERHFEIQRNWRHREKGIEETVYVLKDGQPDDIFTEHWDETIENYLPSSIAHLFFFDGEQIKELAEGGHATEILGTAMHSLLGLDLVDRLEMDLKIFERRKKSDGHDPETHKKLAQLQNELDQLDQAQDKTAMEMGALVNERDRLAKELKIKEDQFRIEGGELYIRRNELEQEMDTLKQQKFSIENQLRELAAGPLPLLLVKDLLLEIQAIAHHETDIRRTRILLDELKQRDANLLCALKSNNIDTCLINIIENILKKDRDERIDIAGEPLLFDADESLAFRLNHLHSSIFPAAEQQIGDLASNLARLDEKIIRLETELERVPTSEKISIFQNELDAARIAYKNKLAELETVEIRKNALEKQRTIIEAKLDKLNVHELNSRFAEDGRLRILKHAKKVRKTLDEFRSIILQNHASRMEVLMLEAFQKLLRKKNLINGLKIDSKTFEPALTDYNNTGLSFDRLSAGEKQLLATSMLWGLARASGRPMPTVIDTPLGRLDSSHRRHLTERYFPNASHQVILLSTDEEIVGQYYETLKPFITTSYLLDHNEIERTTNIQRGYFTA